MQRDGTLIKISEMSDVHIANSIAHLERYAHAAWVNAVNAGPPAFHGEMAQYYADQAWNVLLDDGPQYPDIYFSLVDERESRRTKVAQTKPKGKRK
jgi:hypothetical protein